MIENDNKHMLLIEEPLHVKFDPTFNKFAISLLNSTVHIYYTDTLKPVLSLYGHSLPVTTIDISSDIEKIATGGADKSIIIWDFDYGNIIKQWKLGHENGVLVVKFIHNTHYLISGGRDGMIRMWDCDKYKLLFEYGIFKGCIIWDIIYGDGLFYICGNDKTIRKFIRTDEQVFLKEIEREREDKKFDIMENNNKRK